VLDVLHTYTLLFATWVYYRASAQLAIQMPVSQKTALTAPVSANMIRSSM